eukprot:1437_1
MFLFIAFYCYKWRQYLMLKKIIVSTSEDDGNITRSNTQLQLTATRHKRVHSQSATVAIASVQVHSVVSETPLTTIAGMCNEDEQNIDEKEYDNNVHRYLEDIGLGNLYNKERFKKYHCETLMDLRDMRQYELELLGIKSATDKITFVKSIEKLTLRLFFEQDIKLEEYYEIFVEHHFESVSELCDLKRYELRQMQISNIEHQTIILEGIETILINERCINVKPGDPRSIDGDTDLYDQLVPNEDVIQRVIAHVIQCCDDQCGFDIYQVLAIRYYDTNSRAIKGKRWLSKIGIYQEFISLPPFIHALFVFIIVGLAQTVGISVVSFKLLDAYFSEGHFEDICQMEASRWNNVYSLRMLSFIFALTITFYVSILMNKMDHSGLYAI